MTDKRTDLPFGPGCRVKQSHWGSTAPLYRVNAEGTVLQVKRTRALVKFTGDEDPPICSPHEAWVRMEYLKLIPA